MAKAGYGKLQPEFWTGQTGRSLRGKPHVQLLALYLASSPQAHMSGLYLCPLSTAARHIGISISEARAAMGALTAFGYCTYDEEWVFVRRMGEIRIGGSLSRADKRWGPAWSQVDECESDRLRREFVARYDRPWNGGREGASEAPSEAPSEGAPEAMEHVACSMENLMSGSSPPRPVGTTGPEPVQAAPPEPEPSPEAESEPPSSKPESNPAPSARRQTEEAKRLLGVWNLLAGQALRSDAHLKALKARAKEHGPPAVELVIRWASGSKHPRASWLREGGYGLKTLLRPKHFDEYLQIAEQERRARGNGSPGRPRTRTQRYTDDNGVEQTRVVEIQ